MKLPTSARDEVLAHIRSALPQRDGSPEASYAAIDRSYASAMMLDPEQVQAVFLDRLRDYDAKIVQIESEANLSKAISGVLLEADEQRVLVAPHFPDAWLPSGFHFQSDDLLEIETLKELQAVLTTCEIAVAISGTIILVHEGFQGRRAMTLLPDHHICLVRRSQIVATLPQALKIIGTSSSAPITMISGPSATSDIEMTRIRGVHGPRILTVILF